MKKLILLTISLLSITFLPITLAHDLKGAIASDDRTPKNMDRDVYRHPYETLEFFGIKTDMTVIELSPGGGWYTEILANYIHYPGTLIAAHFNPEAGGYYKRGREYFEKKMDSDPMYGRVEIVDIDSSLAEANSVDAVLTFRNLHNWLGPQLDTIFTNSYKALKPGGIFGVVEHRANPGTSLELMKKSGYVTVDHALKMAKKHGFEYVSSSEVNSNPKDIKDYPKGVWTLPPNLRMNEVDKAKYIEIGESDRMTLLFRKPL